MNRPAIEIYGLKVKFGLRLALEIEELAVNSGEFVALMGRNGAGKSTFIKTCLGLQKKAQGVVRVLGVDLDRLTPMEIVRLRRRIGYVPQLLPPKSQLPITAREVVAIGRAAKLGLFKVLNSTDHSIVDKWIRELGLLHIADSPFNQLSGGEQRKVMIARAMAQEPELLLLDEPTANLDLGWREHIIHSLNQLHKTTGITILLISHEIEVISNQCGKIILLENGKIAAQGTSAEIFTPERVKALYGLKGSVISHRGRNIVVPEYESGTANELKDDNPSE
ncbi:MAG: ABC transporter ATP-binding protein [Verrucomicrobiia bacterium]|jgi:iron complex transport system ATP-binding protein